MCVTVLRFYATGFWAVAGMMHHPATSQHHIISMHLPCWVVLGHTISSWKTLLRQYTSLCIALQTHTQSTPHIEQAYAYCTSSTQASTSMSFWGPVHHRLGLHRACQLKRAMFSVRLTDFIERGVYYCRHRAPCEPNHKLDACCPSLPPTP